MKATTADAYKLMHEGAIALAHIERNGIQIDVPYCQAEMEAMQKELDSLQENLLETELGKEWKRVARKSNSKLSLQKDDQLRSALYDRLGMKTERKTKKGGRPVDADTLREFEQAVDGIGILLDWRTLRIARNTFMASVLREQEGGMLHPFFNLHLVRTYRSSSDSPNFQNLPHRNKGIAKRVRRMFIPRPGRRLIEADYSGVETRVPCFYCHDPNLIAYVSDPEKDMHRDMAMMNFKLPAKEINYELRHSGKNETVFPWFYGDWAGSTGAVIWKSTAKYKTASGVRLRKHLKEQGIGTEAKFMKHHEAIYDRFWGPKWFRAYSKWREQVWQDYIRDGYIEMLTGFRCVDLATFNEATNKPIQGTAFHLLLWSLIELQKELEKREMKTAIVGQIHDSIMLDVPSEEEEIVIRLAKRIMTRKIRRHWKWINVPLLVDFEGSKIDGSWAEMEEIEA